MEVGCGLIVVANCTSLLLVFPNIRLLILTHVPLHDLLLIHLLLFHLVYVCVTHTHTHTLHYKKFRMDVYCVKWISCDSKKI